MGKIDWNAGLDDGVKVLFDPEEDAKRIREQTNRHPLIGRTLSEQMDRSLLHLNKVLPGPSEMIPTPPSKRQIGGDHYKNFPIQPAEFIHKNNLGFLVGNIVKYACRYKIKGGKEDLLKCKHYIDLLLEWEYGIS